MAERVGHLGEAPPGKVVRRGSREQALRVGPQLREPRRIASPQRFRDEALKHLTIWPAFAAFQEQQVGSITVGKLADIVVLSQDIMTIPAEDILKTQVELTVVGGKIVYDKNTPRT